MQIDSKVTAITSAIGFPSPRGRKEQKSRPETELGLIGPVRGRQATRRLDSSLRRTMRRNGFVLDDFVFGQALHRQWKIRQPALHSAPDLL